MSETSGVDETISDPAEPDAGAAAGGAAAGADEPAAGRADDAADEPAAGGADDVADEPAARPWYRRLAFLAPVGLVAGPLGLFFVGFIALLALFTDWQRDRDVRLGGSVLLLWWLWTWTLPGTAPLIGVSLLLVAAVFLVRAARGIQRPGSWVAGVLAATAVVLAGVALFPDGIRAPELGEDDALRRTLEARRRHAGNVDAAQADVVLTRQRFTNRPYYFVVLHEPNPERQVTGDGEPCFRRAEVHLVDAFDGTVERQRVTDALPEDGNCLPLRVGTKEHLVPVQD